MKISKLAIVMLASAAIVSLNSCVFSVNLKKLKEQSKIVASGKIVKLDTLVQDFESIESHDSFDITYYQKDTVPCVVISASDNVLPYIKVKSEDGKLTLSYKEDHNGRIPIFNMGSVTVKIFSKSIKSVEIVGSGDFTADGLKSDVFSYSCAGSGDMVLKDMTCNSFLGTVAGSGDIRFDGIECKNFSASVAGSGDIQASRIKCDILKANVAGSGDISLSGSAAKADLRVSGSGDIDAKHLVCDNISTSTNGSGDIDKPRKFNKQ